jgi:uncharacterized coiled-coil protein SlyX
MRNRRTTRPQLFLEANPATEAAMGALRDQLAARDRQIDDLTAQLHAEVARRVAAEKHASLPVPRPPIGTRPPHPSDAALVEDLRRQLGLRDSLVGDLRDEITRLRAELADATTPPPTAAAGDPRIASTRATAACTACDGHQRTITTLEKAGRKDRARIVGLEATVAAQAKELDRLRAQTTAIGECGDGYFTATVLGDRPVAAAVPAGEWADALGTTPTRDAS